MTIKKLVPALAAAFCLSLTAFAGTPETKSESPSKSEGAAKLHVYYVTGISGSNYTLSSMQSPNCDQEPFELPCEITSTNQITTGLAPIGQVDNQTNGYSIITKQPPL